MILNNNDNNYFFFEAKTGKNEYKSRRFWRHRNAILKAISSKLCKLIERVSSLE